MGNTSPKTVRAFTLVEMLVVLGIIAIIAAIIFPVFSGLREQARRTTCLSNLRQISLALTAYTQDNSGFFPPAHTNNGDWAGTILSYAPAEDVFHCPSCPVPSGWEAVIPGLAVNTAKGYAMNFSLYGAHIKTHNAAATEAHVRFPTATVAVCEFAYRSGPQSGATGYPSVLTGPDDGTELPAGEQFIGPAGAVRHQGGSNYVFVDGHAQWLRAPQVLRNSQGNDGSRASFAL